MNILQTVLLALTVCQDASFGLNAGVKQYSQNFSEFKKDLLLYIHCQVFVHKGDRRLTFCIYSKEQLILTEYVQCLRSTIAFVYCDP